MAQGPIATTGSELLPSSKGLESADKTSHWRDALRGATVFVGSAAVLTALNFFILFLLELRPIWFVVAMLIVAFCFWAWLCRRTLLNGTKRWIYAGVYGFTTAMILNTSATFFNNFVVLSTSDTFFDNFGRSLEGFMPASAGEWRQLTLMLIALVLSSVAGAKLGTAFNPGAVRLNERSILAELVSKVTSPAGHDKNGFQRAVVAAVVEAVVVWLLGWLSGLASLVADL